MRGRLVEEIQYEDMLLFTAGLKEVKRLMTARHSGIWVPMYAMPPYWIPWFEKAGVRVERDTRDSGASGYRLPLYRDFIEKEKTGNEVKN
jgi:hypothetical protein